MKGILGTVLLSLFFAGTVLGYDLVLKNGKVIQGKLIQEDAEKFVIEDKSGLRINFKKSSVDLEKTTAANQVKEEPAPAPVVEKKVEEEKPPEPKKPARVYTERDIQRVRSKSAILKSDTPAEEPAGTETETENKTEEKGEEYWRSTARQLHGRMQQAEASYQQALRNCQLLKGASIQTHVVVDEKGEVQDMQKSTADACQQAEDLKAASEEAKQEYEAFLQEARMEVVPPGWLNVD